MAKEQSVRIQTSFLNAAEKKALVWLAERQPKWMTSDILTFIGFLGAVIIAVGYALSANPVFLWLASFGWIINWYGDSLDGTLARVRKQQRPVYGFFIDHTVDCINESIMIIGIGMSPFMQFDVAIMCLVAYLLISVYVYISAHLKGEFKLTYGKMGPTELRVIMIIVNTLWFFIPWLREYSLDIKMFGNIYSFSVLDFVGIFLFVGILIAYFGSLIKDGREYAKADPLKKNEQ
ncbi:MAG: CDP-alcohol phosphatidyltransferase family protein [Bacteroidales bacterium]|nr:CDP-alcohol phosphatidyltransferase family protein [Bacteroidales bacterium]MBQ2090900.1 CDP-alcohol phosphatidyltransferase family protein [Bacteroidales bacterium]MCR5363775.1 CDP-alcohol phosphatidyltransferase family protein [Bacteroidales bacterium]